MVVSKRKKRAKKDEPKEGPSEGNRFDKLKPYFEKYGYLFAFASAIPLISGWLLFNEKDCGCFLLPKSTLEANNELLGLVSIVAGLALLLPAVFQYTVIGKRKRKDWKIRYDYLFAFILAVGMAWFYIGLETQPGVTVEATSPEEAGEFGNVEPSDTITITSEQAEVIGLYKTLNRPTTHEPGKVKLKEFFSFYCDNCYEFNDMMHELEGKYAGKVEVELVPIYWGDGSIKPGEAYIIAESLGFGTEMADAIFEAQFIGGQDIGNEDVLIKLAKEIGLGDEFATKLKSGEAEAMAKENLRLAGVYEVEETPTLIVDDKLRVSPHETGDNVFTMAENLDIIIEAFLEM